MDTILKISLKMKFGEFCLDGIAFFELINIVFQPKNGTVTFFFKQKIRIII